MKKKKIFLCWLIAFLISPVFGQNINSRPNSAITDTLNKSLRLFEDDKPLEISLQFDLTTYFRTKSKEDYLNAQMTIHLSKSDSITKKIKLRTRGVFRNQYCTFAPIELNLKNAGFGFTDLNRITKIKLVPECRAGIENENYVLREYLVYKLFNVLTDTSFRVRMVNINYTDTGRKRKSIKQSGFFIEPIELLADRTKTIQVSNRKITQKNIIPMIMDRLAIFNYMIGNYDWAVPGQHNVRVFKSQLPDTVDLGIAVPFDFDWTGLVNPDYAIPAENIGTQTVRERIFLGVCRRKEVFQKDLIIFSKNKEAFYRIINDFPYLKQREKKDMTRYLDQFFDQLGGGNIMYYLQNTCKKF